jgi:glutathionylspermidine synthase
VQRIPIQPRPDLAQRAKDAGFAFATIDGEVYWDERAYYAFSLREIEMGFEDPSNELSKLCLELVDRAVKDQRLLERLAIPEHAWGLIAESWQRRDPSLYGRFDLAYDGYGPAKLLEYNADTPTALFEASVFQWTWLEDALARNVVPDGADQFNSLHEALVAALSELRRARGGDTLHLAAMPESKEDIGLISYLAECATQAGFASKVLAIGDIGSRGEGPFLDLQEAPINLLFKLYPWEWMFRDEFIGSPSMNFTRFLEPPWKAILSNKGILPLLWEMAPRHPNLLAAYFEDDPARSALSQRHVRKPLHSREGSNVTLVEDGATLESTQGPYVGPCVLQDVADLPSFGENVPVIGSWIIAGKAHGIGVREDTTLITRDTSRFMPHAIVY